MNPRGITTSQVHAALEREPRVNIHRHPIRIASADGVVTLEGEVADVAAFFAAGAVLSESVDPSVEASSHG